MNKRGLRRVASMAAMALIAAMAGVVPAAVTAAALPSACTLNGSTVTCTWTSGTNQFAVPAGVTTLHVTAVGGKGGDTDFSIHGGYGAEVSGDITVTAGTSVFAVVGGNGGHQFPQNGPGGANGGGDGIDGSGGGGGASDVRTSQADLASRLIVAGGGGGAGKVGTCCVSGNNAPGGAGGAAGDVGGSGTDYPSNSAGDANGGGGGGAGTASAGGAGGAGGTRTNTANGADGCPGTDGAIGQGGVGGQVTGPFCAAGGGGGGGGVYGGGGGGGGASESVTLAGSGGGGGGSSLVPAGGSIQPDSTGSPKVVISYTAPERVSPTSIDFGSQAVGGTSAAHTVTLSSAAGLTVSSVTLTGTNPGDFAIGSDTCSGQTLAAGGSCTVQVSFAPLATGLRTATLSFTDDGLTSPQTVDLSGTGTTAADVSVAISGPTSAANGSQNTYVVTVANAGPSTALNVIMTTSVPAGTKLVSVSTTRGTCAAPKPGAISGAISCSLGDLAKGDAAVQNVALKITLNARGGSVALSVHAQSTATNTTAATPDPALANNTATRSTTITKK